MKCWAILNTNLSTYYALYLLLKHSYLIFPAHYIAYCRRVLPSLSCRSWIRAGVLFNKLWLCDRLFEQPGPNKDCYLWLRRCGIHFTMVFINSVMETANGSAEALPDLYPFSFVISQRCFRNSLS